MLSANEINPGASRADNTVTSGVATSEGVTGGQMSPGVGHGGRRTTGVKIFLKAT